MHAETAMLKQRLEAGRRQAKRLLSYGYDEGPKQYLLRLADQVDEAAEFDGFGSGEIYRQFDAEVARILGKPAALFFPTGRGAQMAVLRAWQDIGRSRTVALHPRCHLAEAERMAYQRGAGAVTIPIGDVCSPLTIENVESLTEDPGLICLESPMLALGCRLIAETDLKGIYEWASQRAIPVHLDGARLWEAACGYGCTPAQVAAYADSVFVSFYKCLGAASGAAIAGPEKLIARLRVLREETGGCPPKNYPMVADSLLSMRRKLATVSLYRAKAVSLAKTFGAVEDVIVNPAPPHTDTFRVILRGTERALREATLQVANETGIWMVDVSPPLGIDGYCQFQVVVGDATLDIDDSEAGEALALLRDRMTIVS